MTDAAHQRERAEAAEQDAERLYQALKRHEQWCGFNKNAPGDSIWYEAMDAHDALVASSREREA